MKIIRVVIPLVLLMVVVASLLVAVTMSLFGGPYLNDTFNGIRSISIALDGERDFNVTYSYKEPAAVVLSFYAEHTNTKTGKVSKDSLQQFYLTPEDALNISMAMQIVMDVNHPLESN